MKKITALLIMLAFSAYANAEPVGGIGYSQLKDSGIALGAITVTGGYKFDMSSNFSITPEVRVGFGASDDTYLGASVKLDSLYGVNLRAQWDSNNAYFYIAPSYSTVKIKASFGGFSASGNDSQFGGGLGAGYRFSGDLAIEGSYENFDGTDVYSVGLRYFFKQ